MRYVSTLVSRSSPFGRRELFRTSTAGVRLLHSFVYGRRRVSHPWTRPWPVQTHCERDACAPSRPDGHSSAARQVAGDHAAEGGTPAIGALALGLINIFRCASSEGPEVARSRRFSSSLRKAGLEQPGHSRPAPGRSIRDPLQAFHQGILLREICRLPPVGNRPCVGVYHSTNF